MRNFLKFCGEIFTGVRPDFGHSDHQRQLTLTFNFIHGMVGLLLLLTTVWAMAAGVLQSGRFMHYYATYFGRATFIGPSWQWVLLPVAVIAYAGKAFSVAMLICLAAASFGAVTGFLFGVPRPISESAPPAAAVSPAAPAALPAQVSPLGPAASRTTDQAPAPAAKPADNLPAWQANTNLTQISDWLTKIIVGVGLVEAHKVYGLGGTLSTYVSGLLFGGLVGASLVLPALMISGLVLGFMYSYLFTQLFLAALMAYAAKQVSTATLFDQNPEAASMLNDVSPGNPVFAPAIQELLSGTPARPGVAPSPELRNAAKAFESIPLEQLTDPASISLWARAQAVLDKFGPAADGYRKLLRSWRTPDLLGEAARVFAASGDFPGARDLINEAAQQRSRASKASNGRITFDAANLALYDPPPGGYRQALDLLDSPTLAADTTGALHILRACANGQRYKYELASLTEIERLDLRKSVLEDLTWALTDRIGYRQRATNLPWVRYLLGRDPTGNLVPTLAGPEDVDDDLSAFREDSDFTDLIK